MMVEGATVKRRGILAAAAAVVAGITLKQAGEPVSAAFGDSLTVGATKTPSSATDITGMKSNFYTGLTDTFLLNNVLFRANNVGTPNPASPDPTVALPSNSRIALAGTTNGSDVNGTASTANIGVYGEAGKTGGPTPSPTYGVVGVTSDVSSLLEATTAGVYGQSGGGAGVFGYSSNYIGIYGASGANLPYAAGVFGDSPQPSAAGVAGRNTSGASTSTAILGTSVLVDGATLGPGTGVMGKSGSGTGVAGVATSGTGVAGGSGSAAPGTAGGYFYTTANNGSGVVGQCFNPGGGAAAFVGAAVAPNYAAYFTGDVVVTGNFVVAAINGHPTSGGKSAAVQHPLTKDTRLVYCVESPDSWFEDFGEGQIVAGKGEVKVDPNFMALIHTDSYHVFLTPHDEEHHLAVKARDGKGFAVAADATLAKLKGKAAADLNGTFSWRVVGKRSDVQLERLAKFAMPTITVADKPPVFPAPVATPVNEPGTVSAPAPVPQPRPAANAPASSPAAPAGQGGQGASPASVPAPLPPSR